MHRRMVLGGLIVVMVLGLSACGGDDDDGNVLGGANGADLVIDDEVPFYDPKTLEMPLNREVVFTVFNDGAEVHNFTIPGLEIAMDIPPGERVEVTLPATDAPPRDGFYLFYCKFHQFEGEAGRINISR